MFYTPVYSEEFLDNFAEIIMKHFAKTFTKELKKRLEKKFIRLRQNRVNWTQAYANYARKYLDKVISINYAYNITSSDHFQIQ